MSCEPSFDKYGRDMRSDGGKICRRGTFRIRQMINEILHNVLRIKMNNKERKLAGRGDTLEDNVFYLFANVQIYVQK
jgi:hypothetical protein